MKSSYFHYTLQELTTLFYEHGLHVLDAKDVFSHLYPYGTLDLKELNDISEEKKDVLTEVFELGLPEIFVKKIASDGTLKLLLKLQDGFLIETVLMKYRFGNVVCVTSQVGCSVGCSFCASGLLKKQRNLKAHEIVSQVVMMNQFLRQEGEQLATHVVFMGTGEPFDNYDQVMQSIRVLNDPKGLALGLRHITVSTSGFPSKIKAFARETHGTNLAVSLHAPTDAIRTSLMKINQAFPLTQLMEAIVDYQAVSKKRITFEYILIAGINDQLEHADLLADLIRDLDCYVNLIPYNEVMENNYKRPDEQAIQAFMNRLMQQKILCTVRKEFGHDIDAACGQLRAKYAQLENR
jgi:23S rRNA (adenine2503-C2)-methyltransferase